MIKLICYGLENTYVAIDLKLKIENTPIPAYRDQDQSEFVKARDKKMQSN